MKSFLFSFLFFLFYFWGYTQSCSVNVSGTQNWRDASWSCSGGASPPTSAGDFDGDLTLSGGGTLVLGFTLRVLGSVNIGSNGFELSISAGDSLLITGDFDAENRNNINLNVDGALGVFGTLSAKNNSVFEGSGYVDATTIQLKNNTACGGGGCPTIVSDNCTTGNKNFCSNVASAPPETLPVDLVNFEAIQNDDDVILVWLTTAEINNDYFTIERSSNGKSFDFVTEVAGAGTTNEPQHYEVVDPEPLKGTSFYRLKQTDFNGEYSYSETVSVLLNTSEDFSVEVFPNPVQGHTLYLKVPNQSSDDFNVFVNDLLGQDYITDLTFIDQGSFTLVVLELSSNLPSGVYFVNVMRNGEVTTKKVMVK